MQSTETLNTDISEAEFVRLAEIVHDHCGIDLRDGKQDLIRARLAKQTRVGNFTSSSHYLQHVLADVSGPEFTGLIDALSTNLTSFYRENSHFDYLTTELLPALLLQKRRQGTDRIRAWSAGCSSGEEAYTLAMTLLEATNGGQGWDIKLLATDISTRVLDIAKGGIYEKQKAASIPAELRNRYFSSESNNGQSTVQANAQLKSLISFRHLNLMGKWPFSGPFDFIFCRNVMIYFDKPTQQQLILRFKSTLAPGAMLFTGHSESLNGIAHGLKYVQPTIYANR